MSRHLRARDVLKIRHYYSCGWSSGELAQALKLPRATVSRCANFKTHADVIFPPGWRPPDDRTFELLERTRREAAEELERRRRAAARAQALQRKAERDAAAEREARAKAAEEQKAKQAANRNDHAAKQAEAKQEADKKAAADREAQLEREQREKTAREERQRAATLAQARADAERQAHWAASAPRRAADDKDRRDRESAQLEALWWRNSHGWRRFVPFLER